MTTKDEMLELAERCEKATGPDRLLDRDIAEALNLDWPNRGPFAKGFTTSLDAAMTLVPEGWGWTLESEGCCKMMPGEGMTLVEANAADVALALCAAALRARASHKDSNTPGE